VTDQVKLKILIVDDDPHIIKQYDAALPDAVFEKQFTKEGLKALELYENWKPQIILLDIMLPGISGFNILKNIRQELADTKTVIIMSTALSSQDDVRDCLALGIGGYIIKPLNLKEVAKTILTYYKKAIQQ